MKEGIDKAFPIHEKRIDALEDGANLKSVLLVVSKKILSDLVSKYKLSNDDAAALDASIEKTLTNSITNRGSELRTLLVETLRDTMHECHIEAPGLRDDYLEELEERMRVKVH